MDKIGPIIRRGGPGTSSATVGRILRRLTERGKVTPVPELIRKQACKSPPKKRPHVIRKPRDAELKHPGDVIQIDTLTLNLAPGRTIRHFDAYDVFAKWTVAKPYARATAQIAADLLKKVGAEMPWPVKAIQINGGSEFMAEFGQACEDKKLPLYVLPPGSPKLSGAAERCNGAWRYEFYAATELPRQIDKIAEHADAFQHLCNHHRPHGALDGLTPAEYLKICRERSKPQSHM